MSDKSPWHKVTNEGVTFMVRENDGATWAIRLPDRAVFFWDKNEKVPTWQTNEPHQQTLL